LPIKGLFDNSANIYVCENLGTWNSIDSSEERILIKKALQVITILHEVCHLKRFLFASEGKLGKRTSCCLKYIENQKDNVV